MPRPSPSGRRGTSRWPTWRRRRGTAGWWPGPDAYPEVFHKERGLSLRPPLAWELELMEGCLRAVPEFVGRHKQDDPAREEMTVPVASGSLSLVLSWVIEDAA